jgi:hypothetical protein
MTGALPNLVIIGAMKCGTTALHYLLDRHPDVAMASGKELNFFFGLATSPGDGTGSTWHRGLEWYASQFDHRAVIRGESSPGYTSPDHPETPERMAAIVPDARLAYLVRDPIDRAISQYRHHRAERTETRPASEALLDPLSQYVARGRYFERLAPFLRSYRREQIVIISQEDLLRDTDHVLGRVCEFLDLDRPAPPVEPRRQWNASQGAPVDLPRTIREQLAARFADDVAWLREYAGQEFAGWSV